MKCKLHPKYKGIKPPTSTKEGCICSDIYFNINKLKVRAPILPTKVIKDKSKYNRKIKHKKGEKDDS